jgi:hypothetical protein
MTRFQNHVLEIFQASSLLASNKKNFSFLQNQEATVAKWIRCLTAMQEDLGSSPTWVKFFFLKKKFFFFFLKKFLQKNFFF